MITNHGTCWTEQGSITLKEKLVEYSFGAMMKKLCGEELWCDDEKNGGVEIWCNHDINQWRHRLILQRHGAPYPTLMQCHHANQPILKVPIKLSNLNIIPKEPRRRSVVKCCLAVLL